MLFPTKTLLYYKQYLELYNNTVIVLFGFDFLLLITTMLSKIISAVTVFQ